jgi:NAD(P)-dependent dehydrogenase (short-subunit alcohol dehydrogenase family)
MLKMFDLSGRKALVTGASRGIGRAIAVALAEAGADVALASRNCANLCDVVEVIAHLGKAAPAVTIDVRSVDSCRSGIAAAVQALGGLDILINNAGYEEVRPSLEVEEQLWDRIVDTNLKGAFFCAQAAARAMVRTGSGSIINLCSLTSYVGIPTAVPYGSSKSGLLGMTRALATEWASAGIRVNAIAPGYFRTAMTEQFYLSIAWQADMLARIPQRRFGELDDLAGVVLFLASRASSYITGQCIAVDGGYLASI